jgi:hypothetical protein
MRLAVSSAVLLLTACATAPPPTAPIDRTAPATPSAADPRIARLLAAAGQADAPTRATIERELGPADIARQDGAGVALTYRLQNCALLLLFAADPRNEMLLRQAHVSARRAGDTPPTLERCAAEASSRRS